MARMLATVAEIAEQAPLEGADAIEAVRALLRELHVDHRRAERVDDLLMV